MLMSLNIYWAQHGVPHGYALALLASTSLVQITSEGTNSRVFLQRRKRFIALDNRVQCYVTLYVLRQ